MNPDSDSEKNQEVNVGRSEVVRRFDSVTPSSEVYHVCPAESVVTSLFCYKMGFFPSLE